jgi:SAM-dependent methyltransferase
LFALKGRIDPHYRLRNALWDKYYGPELGVQVEYPTRIGAGVGLPVPTRDDTDGSEFHQVMTHPRWHDAMYAFLQNVFRLYPEDRFNHLIREACDRFTDDESIYRHLQVELPRIKPTLGDVTFSLPALKKQKGEMLRQTLDLLGERRAIDGYVEIGTTGRYASVLRKSLKLTGPLVMVNETAPTSSLVDVLDRGGFRALGRYLPLANYAPLSTAALPDRSVDFVSCYIGLHHIARDRLGAFMASIARVLRPGGVFVLRDHDVTSPEMFRFVSLIHTVFNAGTGAKWEQNQAELRHFVALEEWSRRLAGVGLVDSGRRLYQAHDPSDNVLMSFVKEGK